MAPYCWENAYSFSAQAELGGKQTNYGIIFFLPSIVCTNFIFHIFCSFPQNHLFIFLLPLSSLSPDCALHIALVIATFLLVHPCWLSWSPLPYSSTAFSYCWLPVLSRIWMRCFPPDTFCLTAWHHVLENSILSFESCNCSVRISLWFSQMSGYSFLCIEYSHSRSEYIIFNKLLWLSKPLSI